MKTQHTRSILALVASLSIISAFHSVQGDSFLLTLEQSTDMKEWTPVEVTPEMLDDEGRIVWPVDGGSMFFRMNITGGPSDPNMVTVQGGTLAMSMGTVTVDTLLIGKFEVTWDEWKAVRAEATARGYDIGSVGAGCADNHPVHTVNWYDVVKWCNLKSEIEGLTPVYTLSGATYKSGQSNPAQNLMATGYRLPTEAEWEFAARGGNQTNGHTYSGSNTIGDVAWYTENSGGAACPLSSGRGTWPVGGKAPNELGLHDMSGNVWEWCWDARDSDRRFRGGSWNDVADLCTVSIRGFSSPDFRFGYVGLRLARSKGN